MSSSPGPSPYGRSLSPPKHTRDRSLSRPSSRSSIRSNRAPSPSFSPDDPVAVRSQMSALKHSIRHQQAQLHNLENIILRGPRPIPDLPDMLGNTTPLPPPSSYSPNNSTAHVKRRSSFDVLYGIAGPESSLPLPRREPNGIEENGIREGVPMTFGVGVASPNGYKRTSSPTRTLSRIPVASVGNARALADEGTSLSQRSAPASHLKLAPVASTSVDGETHSPINGSVPSLPPPSPSRRTSFTPGGTTKVLADLQAGVINARTALENTKAQLRLSQRTVAQLTRQTEDLKEGRERLRLENEGLNNVVARKERLLQEVLERARKAEAEAASLKTQLKSETSSSKKALREMESALAESTALSQKSEREYLVLRDSLTSLSASFKADFDKLLEEMKRREARLEKEKEILGNKYEKLVEEVEKEREWRGGVNKLREEDARVWKAIEESWGRELAEMKEEVDKSTREGQEASATAKELATELARLRRLMQTYRSSRGLSGFDQIPAAEKDTGWEGEHVSSNIPH